MKTEDELVLSFYRELNKVGGKRNVSMVQHIESGHICIKKILPICDMELYRSLQKLHVSGIPEILSMIEDEETFIVIEEYINGKTLASLLSETGRLREEDAVDIITQLCGILRVLHNASPSIIHRDIKPENIIIAPENKVYLIDFNAAKKYDPDKNYDTVLMGTVEYAAPEQFGFSQSDVQTDIYALGVLLNVMLTGCFPREKLYDGKLSAIILKCISIDPSKRFRSVTRLSDSLSHGRVPFWFLPPGFRTRTPWKMITAIIAYFCIILTSITWEVEDAVNGIQIYLERVDIFLVFLSFVCIICNYGDIHRKLPLTKSRVPVIKVFGVLIWCAVSFWVLLTLFAVLEDVVC